jgi:hypothetical protein
MSDDARRRAVEVERHLRAALREAEGVDFDDDERELLAHSIAQVRDVVDELERELERESS